MGSPEGMEIISAGPERIPASENLGNRDTPIAVPPSTTDDLRKFLRLIGAIILVFLSVNKDI
jgi:hypothetical protein